MSKKSNKTKPCKSCEHEVAKSAKKCPNCGQKLKSGIFAKAMITIVGLLILIVIMQPTSQEKLQALSEAELSDLSPFDELNSAFSLFSDYTDIQRNNIESEITGLTIAWELPVYEVNKISDGQYRVQTSSANGAVGTFTKVYTSTTEEAEFIEGLKTDDAISIYGTIVGTTLRNIEIDPAVLIMGDE